MVEEDPVTQIHKRFATEQVQTLLQQYCQGTMTRAEVEEVLDISKSRFFLLRAAFRRDPGYFSVAYERASPQRLSSAAEAALEHELRREKGLVEDRRLPISSYNYSAVRDGLANEDPVCDILEHHSAHAARKRGIGHALRHPSAEREPVAFSACCSYHRFSVSSRTSCTQRTTR